MSGDPSPPYVFQCCMDAATAEPRECTCRVDCLCSCVDCECKYSEENIDEPYGYSLCWCHDQAICPDDIEDSAERYEEEYYRRFID